MPSTGECSRPVVHRELDVDVTGSVLPSPWGDAAATRARVPAHPPGRAGDATSGAGVGGHAFRAALVAGPHVALRAARCGGDLHRRARPAAAAGGRAAVGGPTAQVAGSTALRWHGVGSLPDDGLVRMLVDWGQVSRQDGFAVRRRTSRLDANPLRRNVLRICSRPRALVDAARELRDPEAARHLFVEATQRRQVGEQDLMSEVEAGAMRGRRALRVALRTPWPRAPGPWPRQTC